MTRYFMRDTPLCQLEQQMMTPPNFKARGHGRYSPGFQYSSEDTECPYCINFRLQSALSAETVHLTWMNGSRPAH